MEKLSILFMILVIFCTSFSGKIDIAVRGDKQVKKVIVVFSVGALLIYLIVNIPIEKIQFIEQLHACIG